MREIWVAVGIWIVLLAVVFMACNVYAWSGYDYDKGEYIDIESGNLVRSGQEIEVYHWDSGDYTYEDVESVSSGTVETYDWNTGEYKTYDMD